MVEDYSSLDSCRVKGIIAARLGTIRDVPYD